MEVWRLGFLWSLVLGFWDFFQGQFNREPAPLPDRTADRYRSAMRFDDMFDNGQTDADARVSRRSSVPRR